MSSVLDRSLERREVDYSLLSSALKRAGYLAPNKKIHDLMKAGDLIGVKRGLYVVSSPEAKGEVCKESLANLLYGPSCVSLESALAYHELIPERVEVVTSVTPKRDKRFETPLGAFTYRYLSLEKYREGIDLVWFDAKHPVLMACPEKAVCDYLSLNKVRHLSNPEIVRRFFEEDLRVATEGLKRLDLLRMHRLQRFYKNKSLGMVIRYLEDLP